MNIHKISYATRRRLKPISAVRLAAAVAQSHRAWRDARKDGIKALEIRGASQPGPVKRKKIDAEQAKLQRSAEAFHTRRART